MALTDMAIRALKPKDKRYYVTDDRGLCLEVFPTGSMAWRYRYRLHGKLEKVALGRYPAMSLKTARGKRDELAAMVAQGGSPAKQKQLRKQALALTTTVQEFGERYFEDVVKRDRKDPSNIRRYLDKEIYPELGERPMREVTAVDVQSLVFRKRDHGHEAAAAEIRNLIKRVFDYAIVRGVAEKNPALALPTRFITRARPRTRALASNEIRAYLQTLYQSNLRRQFKLALHLFLITMVRKSELLLAQWEHVNFDTGEWEIPAENSKTGQPHIVYLSRQAIELFQELKALAGGSELIMPGRGSLTRPFAHNALNHALSGIHFPMEPFTIHDLRRTASTHLHEAGFPSDVVEKALNHTLGGMRGVYNRAKYAEQRRAMLQFWADYVDGLMNERKVILGRFAKTA